MRGTRNQSPNIIGVHTVVNVSWAVYDEATMRNSVYLNHLSFSRLSNLKIIDLRVENLNFTNIIASKVSLR